MAAWRAISSPFASADLGLSRLFLFFDLFSFFDSFSGLWGCLVMPTPHLTPSPGTCSSSSSIIFINSERDRGIPSDLTPLDIPLETLDMLRRRRRRVRGREGNPKFMETPSPGTCSSSSSRSFIHSRTDNGIPSDLTPLDIPLETLDMLRRRRVRGWERIP